MARAPKLRRAGLAHERLVAGRPPVALRTIRTIRTIRKPRATAQAA